MEAAKLFTYLCDGVCANGGCEVAVTVRRICVLQKFGECGKLLKEITSKALGSLQGLCKICNTVWM